MSSNPACMTVAVASGKGGTGKTTVAVNLAWVAAKEGFQAAIVDADADAPNVELFLRPEWQYAEEVGALVPCVDSQLCDLCGACARVCRYHAIAVLGPTVLVFPELCHGCGGCAVACSAGAIVEYRRRVGEVRKGEVQIEGARRIDVIAGSLDIGEVKAPLVIRGARAMAETRVSAQLAVIDCPPGAACSVVAAAEGTDHLLLVTEPTPFGLHDLELAVRLGRGLGLEPGVVLNRAGAGRTDVEGWCRSQALPLVASIPFDPEVAAAYARGGIVAGVSAAWRKAMEAILTYVMATVVS
jgi:MinD superfamily P-loop ATPase